MDRDAICMGKWGMSRVPKTLVQNTIDKNAVQKSVLRKLKRNTQIAEYKQMVINLKNTTAK